MMLNFVDMIKVDLALMSLVVDVRTALVMDFLK